MHSHRRPHPSARRALRNLGVVLGTATAGALAAQAEANPYYFGAQERLTQVSNLRLNADSTARSSLVSSTALLAGIDQPFGRQRARADLALYHNRYSGRSCLDAGCATTESNSELNNNGYDVSAALDWSTVERVSGTLSLAAGRQLSAFDNVIRSRNIERTLDVGAGVQVGVVTDLSFNAKVDHRESRQSTSLAPNRVFDEDVLSLGVTYRPSSALSLGVAGRHGQIDFPTYPVRQPDGTVLLLPDRLKRDDVDLTAVWSITGASSISTRLSLTRWSHSQDLFNDFSGVTGSLTWYWRPTGKLQVESRLMRDSGTEARFSKNSAALDDSQVMTTGRIHATYEATAKISLTSELKYVDRTLVQQAAGESRGDRTTTVALGARWTPLRPVLVGCDVSHESRNARGLDVAQRPSYTNNAYGCFAQFVLK